SGADFWTTVPVERLDVPKIKVTDVPNGARGAGSLVGGVKATFFPVAIALDEIGIPGGAEHARAIHPEAASTSQRAKQFLNLPITRYF
ncbi:hypothetical protein ACC734_38195, partial [Rhizobium ruizarguesonis]